MSKKGMNKIGQFLSAHKVKVIVYSCLIVASLIIANILLKSAYDFVVSEYERDPSCLQACEDGINTLSKMKYYKNSKYYIKEMKQSIVESYCDSHQFEKAKGYLDENYQKGLKYLYYVIEDREARYEEEKQWEYMQSKEGRTKRVYKMYETRGLGGENNLSAVPRQLISNIEYGTLDDIGYLLPVWNRNDTYLDMLKSNIITISGDSYDPSSTYYVEDWHIVEDSGIETYEYRLYLADQYDIDIEVEQVDVIEYEMRKTLTYSAIGTTQRMLVFKTEGKYFLGGIYRGIGDCSLQWMVAVSDHYKGELDQEY